MKITKLGHCCLLIEIAQEKGAAGGVVSGDSVRILTDPGIYSTGQNSLTDVDFIVISHEHADHYHIDSVKSILAHNPQAKIFTNSAVAALLKKENIPCSVVGHGQSADLNGISLRGWGTKHAIVYKELGQVENTGYFIGGKLWYPGDAFTPVDWPVETLALPVAGPWLKLSEVIEYALSIKPKKCFPVHDAIYSSPKGMHGMLKMILGKESIDFTALDAGEHAEF